MQLFLKKASKPPVSTGLEMLFKHLAKIWQNMGKTDGVKIAQIWTFYLETDSMIKSMYIPTW